MTAQLIPIKVNYAYLKSTCSSCSLGQLCLPLGLKNADLDRLEGIVASTRKCLKGQHLYRSRDSFRSLFAIRTGSFKTFDISEEGNERITGFHMSGDLMGLCSISSGSYHYNAVALEDSSVCELPFNKLESLTQTIPALQHQLFSLMSQAILHEQEMMLILGTMKAEQRIAHFLLELSKRYTERGYSPSHFYLRMTRSEIGNYLGLTVETVSRIMTRFQDAGLIEAQQRDITLKNMAGLQDLLHHIKA